MSYFVDLDLLFICIFNNHRLIKILFWFTKLSIKLDILAIFCGLIFTLDMAISQSFIDKSIQVSIKYCVKGVSKIIYFILSIPECKKDVNPLPMQWSYIFFNSAIYLFFAVGFPQGCHFGWHYYVFTLRVHHSSHQHQEQTVMSNFLFCAPPGDGVSGVFDVCFRKSMMVTKTVVNL